MTKESRYLTHLCVCRKQIKAQTKSDEVGILHLVIADHDKHELNCYIVTKIDRQVTKCMYAVINTLLV